MRISKLDHLVLVTSDLSRCVSFYRDLLHMEVEEKDGRFALRFGTSKINIHTCPGEFQPAADRTKGFLPPSAAGAVCVRSGHRAYDGNIFYPA